jgi:hypothetical protein
MTDYIKHEWQKWDFSKTRNTNTVKGQFILEYILWHPVYAHFKSVKEQCLLDRDIENYAKRNRKGKAKPEERKNVESLSDEEVNNMSQEDWQKMIDIGQQMIA